MHAHRFTITALAALAALTALAAVPACTSDVGAPLTPLTGTGSTPASAILVTPDSPAAGRVASFDSRAALGAEGERTWNFGDGSADSGSVVNHVFTAAGQYAVSVTMADGRGASVTVAVHSIEPKRPNPPL